MTTTAQPRTIHPPVTTTYRPVLRTLTTVLVWALLAQILLGAACVSFVDVSADPTPRWLVDVHAGLGFVILLLALSLLVAAMRSHERRWITTSVVAFVALLVAFGAGDTFVRRHGLEWAGLVMAAGCVVALAACTRALASTRGRR